MMVQHTFIDCSPKPLSQNWPKTGAVPTKTWCQGNTLISLNVDTTGLYEIVFRRPVGVTVFESRLQNDIGKMNMIEQDIEKLFPKPTVSTASKRVRSASEGSVLGGVSEELSSFSLTNEIIPSEIVRARSLSIGGEDPLIHLTDNSASIDPTFLLLQFQPYPAFSTAQESPVPLANDDATKRALSVLDRTPSIDLHKIGVVYAGQGQTTEAEILSNTFGSEFYSKFLHGLGVFVPLANNKDIYTGGLDNSSDCFDGEFGLLFVPDPRLSQMIFHVTTMMPTSALDKLCTSKKRHIGNDFVNIIWNETGHDYHHDTIPAQFNLIQIIIEPLGSIDSSFQSANFLVTFWYRKDIPIPPPLPILVSGTSLASFVRQNAIYSNMIAQVFSSGEASSNAKERLVQIKRIKSRIEKSGLGTSNLDFTNLVVK
jgi:Rap/ran-GAP